MNSRPAPDWQDRVAPVTRSTAQARTTYDRIAHWYDLVEAPFERRARAAGLRLLDPQPGERILEIGHGTGHTQLQLARRVGPTGLVVGVDLSRKMTDVTRRRLSRGHLDVHPGLAQGDARQLPLGPATVNAVTMSFVLELMHTADIPTVLSECRRVLTADGRLVAVALDLPPRPPRAVSVYLAAHRAWPRLVDCRPLPLQEVLDSNGFRQVGVWRSTIVALPVAAILAQPA
jgi:demethylmenaquinone methyltransferase/2-methoxy-6-polyprenyl-1,4-benzoquinol methylase